MTWVWDYSEARGNDRLVLLPIADQADDLGLNAYPSQRRIARKARVSQSTVSRAVARLEGAGELLVLRPDGPSRGLTGTARYAVVMGRDPVELAHQLHWPEPHLDSDVAAEWEQLELETTSTDARWQAEGHVYEPRAVPAAPYPKADPPDRITNRDEPTRPGGSEVHRGTTSDSPTRPGGSDRRGSEQSREATLAMLDQDRADAERAVPMPAEVRGKLPPPREDEA